MSWICKWQICAKQASFILSGGLHHLELQFAQFALELTFLQTKGFTETSALNINYKKKVHWSLNFRLEIGNMIRLYVIS